MNKAVCVGVLVVAIGFYFVPLPFHGLFMLAIGLGGGFAIAKTR